MAVGGQISCLNTGIAVFQTDVKKAMHNLKVLFCVTPLQRDLTAFL